MKPFSNAYDAIKKLFKKMFGKKDVDEQLEHTEEGLAEAAEKEAEETIIQGFLR